MFSEIKLGAVLRSDPGFSEAVSFESCEHIEGLDGGIVVCVGLDRRDMADRSEEAVIVEPIDPAQGRHFDSGDALPGL